MRNKKLINKETTLHKNGNSAVLSPWKRKGKKKKKRYYNTQYSYLVTHPSTNAVKQGLTLLSGRNMLLSERIFLNCYDEKRYRKNIWYYMAGKVENKKLEQYENENYYLLWWSDKGHFPYICLGLSDEDKSVSRTDNFVNENVFSVTYSRVLSYRKSKLCKKRKINIWNYLSLNYIQCRPSWLIAYGQSYQVTFMGPKHHSLDAPWSLVGNRV